AVDPKAFPTQQCPDAAIAEPGVFPHQLEHPGHQRFLLLAFSGLLPLRRTGLVEDSASPTLGDVEGRTQVPHRSSPPRRAQKFPRATSLSIWLSSIASARSFLSRAFSASSSLSRFIWSAFMPPYWCRQRWKVCSLTASLWQTWAMVRPLPRSTSAWRSRPMTCSGVCRLPRTLSSPFSPLGARRLSYHLDQFLGSTPRARAAARRARLRTAIAGSSSSRGGA